MCSHLRGPLLSCLASGSAIVGTYAGWSRTELDVTLSAGPKLPTLPALGFIRHPVSSWSNTDSHYPIQFGLRCESCRHTISWPQ